MKRLFTIISLAVLFAACEEQEIRQQEEEGQDCIVSLNMIGEISVTEGELTRSTPSANDLYAIQVYKGGQPFACGVFDDISLAKLNLKMGSTYDIRICMVRDAKNYLGEDFCLTNNGIRSYHSTYYNSGSNVTHKGYKVKKYSGSSSQYYWHWNETLGPFYFGGAKGYDLFRSDSPHYYYSTNRLCYNSNHTVYGYEGNTSTELNSYSDAPSSYYYADPFEFIQIREGILNKVSYPTCTDWFYGQVNGYSPNGETATLDVVLMRTGFRLKYGLDGVTDGEVTVKVYNDTRTFIENTTNTASYESEEQFIAFYDTYSAWLYADNYTENMTVAVTWKRSIGVTQDLGTKVIQVKRNCLNNIKITLGSDDKGAGLSLSTEAESSMGATSSTIPVSPAQ